MRDDDTEVSRAYRALEEAEADLARALRVRKQAAEDFASASLRARKNSQERKEEHVE